MKKLILFFGLLFGIMSVNGQTLIRSVLIDFGANDGTNNKFTASPSNGNYWNNFNYNANLGTSPTTFVDKTNAPTPFNAIVTNSNFTLNTTAILGLTTGLSSSLGELAEGNATMDCFFTNGNVTANLKFIGLSTIRRYKFYIFGCRVATDTRVTKYTLTGSTSTSGTLTTSGTNIGGTGINGNNNSLYISTFLNSNASSEIALDVTNNAGTTFAYLNCMKMEEYKATQTITFGSLPLKTTSDINFSPGASSASSATNPITYTSSNTAVATIVNGQIHIVGAGTTDITAAQAGNADYDAATSVVQTLTVSPLQSQSITFGTLTSKNYGDATFGLSASASSGLTVTYSCSNTAVATVSGSTVTIVGAGITDITASQAGNGTYASAASVVQTLTVNKINQTITFGALSAKTDADAPFTVSASSTSGLSVALASSNTAVALVSGNTITVVGAGTTTISASQAGDGNHNAATSVPQTLTVSSVLSVNQSLFFDFGPNETTNGDVTVNPDANGNYWNNITPAAGGTALTAGTTGGTLKNSINTPTSYNLTFTNGGFTPNGKLNGGLLSPYASQFGSNSELAIGTATEDYIYTAALAGSGSVITFSGLNTSKKYKFKIFGSRNSNTNRAAQYTLQGSGAASMGTLQSSTTAGLGGQVYIDAATIYPTTLNVSYTLGQQGNNTQLVTYYGNNSSVYSSGLIEPDVNGNISLTTITTTPTDAFAYINCMKIEEYATAQTITFGALSTKNYGDAAFGLTATASSGLTVSYVSSNTAVATVVGSTVTIVGVGTSIITASQAGNGTYSPASSVSHILTVDKAASSVSVTGTTSFTYTNSAQGPVTSSVSGSTGAVSYSYASVDGTTYPASASKPTNAGAYTVTATVAADANYNAASSSATAFTIDKASQSITFGTLSSKNIGNSNFDLTASSNSGLNVSYSSSNHSVATVSGTTVTLVGVGTTTITASQGGNGNYNAATSVSHDLVVSRPQITIVGTKDATVLNNTVAEVSIPTGTVLNVDAGKTVHAISVEAGGSINITQPLVVDTLTFKAGKTTTFSTKIDNQVTVNNLVRYLRTIDASKWYFMSFPCDVAVSEIKRTDGQALIYNNDLFIKYYDGANRSNGHIGTNWISVAGTETLTANKGYIFGLKDGLGDVELEFPLINTLVSTAETLRTVPVAGNQGTSSNSSDKGWNLVGQPYLSKFIGTNASGINYMLFSDGISNYSTYSRFTATLPTIDPFAAYFIQVVADGSIPFALAGRSLSSSLISANQADIVQLSLTTTTGSDNTCLILDDTQSIDYQIGQDMLKWISTGSDKPQLYSVLNGINYAFNALPLSAVENLQLSYFSKSTGLATISANASQAKDLSSVLLTDNSTNPATITDLLSSDYNFYATAGTTNNRFVLSARKVTTSNSLNNKIDDAKITTMNGKLILSNLSENTYIRVYDVVGHLIVTKKASGNLSEIQLNTAGVYSICLSSDKNSLSTKVIFK